jgi:hypothetical protein
MIDGITLRSECELCRWYEERKACPLRFKTVDYCWDFEICEDAWWEMLELKKIANKEEDDGEDDGIQGE